MALLFDGIDDRATKVGASGLFSIYPFTFAGVVRPVTGAAGSHCVIEIGYGGGGSPKRMIVNNDTTLRIAIGAAGFNFNTITIPNDLPSPHFIAVTALDATNRRGYAYRYDTQVEQVEYSSDVRNDGVVIDPTKLHVGCIASDATETVFANFFSGDLVWLAAWDRYLGSAGDGYDSLRALAHLGPRCMGKPAFLAEFLEGQGSVVYDRSGNGNHAAMSNFPASPWLPVGQPGPWWTRRPRQVTPTPRPGPPLDEFVTPAWRSGLKTPAWRDPMLTAPYAKQWSTEILPVIEASWGG